MDETKAYELYLQAYTKARCGFDAAGYYGVYERLALPWPAVIATAAHDGAAGRAPRTQAEFAEELARFNLTPASAPASAPAGA